MSLYEQLELTIASTRDEIKRSYKRLAMIHHPDRGGNEEKFKKISQAYETLSDDNKRREYDTRTKSSNTRDCNEFIQNSFGRGFPFFNFSNFPGSEPFPENKMINIQQNIELTLNESYNGCTKEISITFTKNCSCYNICQYCKGKGKIQQMFRQGPFIQMVEKICKACIGKGYSVKSDCDECDEIGKYEKTVQFKITFHPKTIYDKISIPLIEKKCFSTCRSKKDGSGTEDLGSSTEDLGSSTVKDKKIGEVTLLVKIKVEKPFQLDKNNLIYNTEIDFVDSLCGKDICIPHPAGDLNINTYNEFGVIIPGSGSDFQGSEYKIKDLGFKLEGNEVSSNPGPGPGNRNKVALSEASPDPGPGTSLGFLYINFKINYQNISGSGYKKYTEEEREQIRKLLI